MATTPLGSLGAAPDGFHDPDVALVEAHKMLAATRALHARVSVTDSMRTQPALQAVLASGFLDGADSLSGPGSCCLALRKCAIQSMQAVEQKRSSYDDNDPLALNCDGVVLLGMWAFVNRGLLSAVRSLHVENIRSMGASILLGALALSPCPLEEITGELSQPESGLSEEVMESLTGADPVHQLNLEHKFGAPVFLWTTSPQGQVICPANAPDGSGAVFEGGASQLCDRYELLRGCVAHAPRVLPGLIHAKAGTLRRVYCDQNMTSFGDHYAMFRDMYVATPLAFHCERLERADIALPLSLGGPIKGGTLLAAGNRHTLHHVNVLIACDVEDQDSTDAATLNAHVLGQELEAAPELLDVRAAMNAPVHVAGGERTPFVPKIGSRMHALTWLSGLRSLRVEIDIPTAEGEHRLASSQIHKAAVECAAECIARNADTLESVEVDCTSCCAEAYSADWGLLAALAKCTRLSKLDVRVTPAALDPGDIAEAVRNVHFGEGDFDDNTLEDISSSWLLAPTARQQLSSAGAAFIRDTLANNAATLKSLSLYFVDADACVAFLETAPQLQQVSDLALYAGGMLSGLHYALEEDELQAATLNGVMHSHLQFQQPTLGAITADEVPAVAALPSTPQVVSTGLVNTKQALAASVVDITAAWLAVMQGVHSMTAISEAVLSTPGAWSERSSTWPAGADPNTAVLQHTALQALLPSAAAGSLKTLFLSDMTWSHAGTLDALQAITAAGASSITTVNISMHSSLYGAATSGETAEHANIEAINAALQQLQRLKHLKLRQSIQVPHGAPSGPSVLHGLRFFGSGCTLRLEEFMTAADMVAVSQLLRDGAQPRGTSFSELHLHAKRRLETELVPNQDLYERVWAQMAASPYLRNLQNLHMTLPAHALGCPSALYALRGMPQLRELQLAPTPGGMSYLCIGEAELDTDEDAVQQRAYERRLSWLGRALDATPRVSLSAAMRALFHGQAHTMDGGAVNNNARMSLRMQMLAAAGYAEAPPGTHLNLFSLLVRLSEDPQDQEEEGAYAATSAPFVHDVMWVAQYLLDTLPIAPEGNCPDGEAAAYAQRQREITRAAQDTLASLRSRIDAGELNVADREDKRLKSGLNLLLAHVVNAQCAGLPAAVLQAAAGGFWGKLQELRLTIPVAGKAQLLHWAHCMCPSLGVRGIRTKVSALYSDWSGGQSGIDAMGYGAASAYPAANIAVMLPAGHHTAAQEAAEALDCPVEHVQWFRIVAPMAAWTRAHLVKEGAPCSEGNNFGAKRTLKSLLYKAELMDTPVTNCFDSEIDLEPLVDETGDNDELIDDNWSSEPDGDSAPDESDDGSESDVSSNF